MIENELLILQRILKIIIYIIIILKIIILLKYIKKPQNTVLSRTRTNLIIKMIVKQVKLTTEI